MVLDERQRLQWLLNHSRATLTDADEHHAKNERLTVWLRALWVLACDVEDVLDEFDYKDLRFTVVEGEGSSGSDDTGGNLVSLVPPQDDQVPDDRIADICRRVNEIIEDKEALLEDWDGEEADVESLESRDGAMDSSFSVSDPELMIGRDQEKDETLGFLLGTPMDDLSVLAVVGIGGVGKTTLARYAYYDGKVDDHFDLRIWVHVSYSFDVLQITKQLVQHVTDPELKLHEIDNFDVLQITLANKLRDRCFLLVLDDMWYEDGVLKNNTAWETLCAPLLCSAKGSKILVTTRSAELVGVMQPVKTLKLEGLGSEDSWSLFKKYAFLDHGDAGTSPNYLEDIGREIVEKLEGVPLAIQAIGSLLRSTRKERDWINVLQSELWQLEQGEGGILPALRVSYEHLHSHLKPCFAYCAVHRKGREFDKLELVQQWIALGYIRPHRRKRMEDVGNDYLNLLVNRSLIQILNGKYTVHALLHELGRSILQRDFCMVASDQLGQQVTAEDQQKYHLSIVHKRVDGRGLAKLPKFWRLRTCVFVFYHTFTRQIPSILFLNMTCLRVLDLSGGGFHVLSDSVGNLKHLRYLNLRSAPVRYLPESLCSLYMLQTLRLQGCEKLESLPKGMCSLINLRHLEAKDELVSGIFCIGRLKVLQELEVFSISQGNGIRIDDLKDMNELRGKLCIRNLQRVGSKEEASLANLSRKEYVNRLELEWAAEDLQENERSGEVEEAILDALVPPPRLKEFSIKFHAGQDFPLWMKHQFITGLESISLYGCQRWKELPPLVSLQPFLKKLEISYLPRLIEIPPFPSTLTHLTLEGMGFIAVPGLQELPLLRELTICNMPNLRELPPLPVALTIFKLEKLGCLRTLPEFHRVHGGGETLDNGGDSNCPSGLLHELKIDGCQNLRSLGGFLREQLPCLWSLSIANCEELVSWPEEEGFCITLLSLQKFSVWNCPKLMALPDGSILSPAMKRLFVHRCPNFPDSSFFAQMSDMKNLKRQEDVIVEKQFQDLGSCSEALKHMQSINCLVIQCISQGGGQSPCISFEYDIQPIGRRRLMELVPYRRVIITIMRNKYSDFEDSDGSTLLPTLLYHHRHLCSSLLSLVIHNVPQDAFLVFPAQGQAEEASLPPITLPSLEELVLMRCIGMRRLPVDTMLCHLRQLNQLSLLGCPELTMPSMEEALQSLPSLQKLVIKQCAKLSLPNLDAAHVRGSDDKLSPSSTVSPLASSSSSSITPPLRSLVTDDVELLANRQFRDTYLTFLHELALWYSDIDFLPTSIEECLRSLGSLTLMNCPNLQELPPDFKSLIPSLEVLCISDCPRLRCIPAAGMPPSLEVIAITKCPGPEDDDWAKVSHVRLIIMDGTFVQGSYSDYQDVMAKGKLAHVRF